MHYKNEYRDQDILYMAAIYKTRFRSVFNLHNLTNISCYRFSHLTKSMHTFKDVRDSRADGCVRSYFKWFCASSSTLTKVFTTFKSFLTRSKSSCESLGIESYTALKYYFEKGNIKDNFYERSRHPLHHAFPLWMEVGSL